MPNRFLWDEVVVNFFIGFENLCSPCCLVPVGRLPSPSRSINSTDEGPGARFSTVPIINGPGKLSPFTLKIEVSIVLHLA